MGDTQRSQTISTEIQRIAKQEAYGIGEGSGNGPPLLVGESSLVKIKMLADSDPELVFTSLVHRIDVHLLKKSFRRVRKSKAAGVDKITAKQYAENLDENLYNLHQRLRRGRYVATPVKRVWIDKEGGKRRPIGIPALEDKIVQRAASTILAVVYDSTFYDFSHAFRKGHSQHQALVELRDKCANLNINWIVSADVTGLFDNIDHGLLRDLIKKRVSGGGLLRVIGKWLNAGVMEDGDIQYPESGTPQGGVISPMLSNIFLHYVLDDWFIKQVKPRLGGRCFIIRWADDFLIGCEYKEDADRVMAVLPKRFERFRLNLHPEKRCLICFQRPGSGDNTKSGTFDFLGFTFYWGRSLKGYWVIKKKTARKRLSRFMKRLWQWCKDYRHDPRRATRNALLQAARILSVLWREEQLQGIRGCF
jgi:RNA-directed DNA polymerase